MSGIKFFDSKTISGAASVTDWVDAAEQAMRLSTGENYVMPQRMHLDYGNDTFLLMPCITNEYWVTKLVSFCPGNVDLDLPSIYGTIVLNSTKTGEPLAVMEGSKITALRTASVSALGIKYLAPENATTLGIVGTGTQGIEQARFACTIRKIKQISIYDRSEKSIARFINEFKVIFPDILITLARDTEQLCLNSEIIITATNSKNPLFPDSTEIFEGKTFIAIGSYKPDYREYPDKFFRQTDQIFVDTIHGKKETGDLIYPIRNHLIDENNVYSLGSLIEGEIALSDNPGRFFKTVGSAIFDLFAAKLVYEKTVEKL